MLPEMKTLVLKHLEERTGSLAYILQMLKAMERNLREDLAALEEVFEAPNPLLKTVLARLEV